MISVIITTYNRYETLKMAVAKVLRQTFRDIEIIVSDDCSTDNTADIIKDFPQIKYYKTPSNIGYRLNSLHGLQKASGEYVIFLSNDDLLIDDTFFEKASVMFADCDAVFGRCRTVRGTHSNYIEYPFQSSYTGKEFTKELEKLRFTFLDYFSFSSFIFKTSIFREIKPFYSMFDSPNSVDIATILKYALFCSRIGFVDVPAYEWKMSCGDSISGIKKDDLAYQTIQSVSAGVDVYNFFGDKEVCKETCNAYMEYIFNAILSDYYQLDSQEHFRKLLEDMPSDNFYIYGKGWVGRALKDYAEKNGRQVLGFIDDYKNDADTVSFEKFAEQRENRDVVIANYKHKAVFEIFRQLSVLQDIKIYDLVSYI